MRKNGQNTKKTGQHSECLGYALKLMRIKFVGWRCQRAECNNYRNCATSLCFPSMAFFDDAAKQAEHNLKIVRYKDQRGKRKKKTQHNQTKQQRGNEAHGRRWGHWFHRAAADARRPAGSQYATPGGLCKPVSGTRLQRLRHLNLNPCATAPFQNSGSLWGISVYESVMRENSCKVHLQLQFNN